MSAQVAISVILLVGAGLLVRGIQHARSMDPGFAIDDIEVASLQFPVNAYSETRTRTFLAQLLSEIRAFPELRSAGFAAHVPLGDSRSRTSFTMPGENRPQWKDVNVEDVSASYFDVLRIPMVAGRNFHSADNDLDVILINEAMSRRYWPGQSAVGKTILTPKPRQIIGVVKDAHTSGLDAVEPTFYRPISGGLSSNILIRRSEMDVSKLLPVIVARLDPRVAVRVQPLSENLERWLKASKVGATLAAALGLLALILASVGIFGVFAYVVQQRTPEIGIRMALGARAHQVVGYVVAGSTRAALIGLILGLAASLLLTRLIESQLYGVSRFDRFAYLGVIFIMTLAAILASYFPARRAARIDPMTALRCE